MINLTKKAYEKLIFSHIAVNYYFPSGMTRRNIIMSNNITLKLEQIKKNPLNTYDLIDMDDLKQSIKLYGILTPLTVIGPDVDGMYTLIAGERRYVACSELRNEDPDFSDELPVFVKGPADTTELQQKLWIEISNLETRDFDKGEHRAKVMGILKQMLESGEITERQVAKEASEHFKVSDRYGRFYRQVFLSDNKELQDMVTDGTIGIRDASKILEFTEEEQKEILDEAKQRTKGKKGDSVRNLIDNHIEAKKEQEKEENIIETESKPATTSGTLNGGFTSTLEELDSMDFDLDDYADDSDINTSIDASNRLDAMYANEARDTEIEYQSKLNSFIDWCNMIKDKDDPTPEEWNVIEACKEVAGIFM